MAVLDNLNLVSNMVTDDADDVSDVVLSNMNDVVVGGGGGVAVVGLTCSDGADVCGGAWVDTTWRRDRPPSRLVLSQPHHPLNCAHHAMHCWSAWPGMAPWCWPMPPGDAFANDSVADVCEIDDPDSVAAAPRHGCELLRDVH